MSNFGYRCQMLNETSSRPEPDGSPDGAHARKLERGWPY